MNLIDRLQKKDPAVRVESAFSSSKMEFAGSTWRCLQSTHRHNEISVDKFEETYAFRSRNQNFGWYACALHEPASLHLSLWSGSAKLSVSSFEVGHTPIPITMRWPLGHPLDGVLTLKVEFEGPARLLIQEVLDRRPLHELARGSGVEIGPGARPQILSSSVTSVRYVEELTQEEWLEIDKEGSRGVAQADWSQYIIGKAANIPVDDASIDFVFLSHVFEHLANPLGHLEHWRSKLRPGGVVLAVVPDLASSKDYRAWPSTVAELDDERRRQIWEPEETHYKRFTLFRKAPKLFDKYFSEKKSIHVHFYSQENMPAILGYAVEKLNYRAYDFIYHKNHKDFHFALYA